MIAPMIWKTMYPIRSLEESFLSRNIAIEIAGLRWQPETLPTVTDMTTTVRPNAIAQAAMLSESSAAPTPKNTRTAVPMSSAVYFLIDDSIDKHQRYCQKGN